MMRQLSNLKTGDLEFLKTQWLAEIGDLNKRIQNRNARLDRRIARNSDEALILEELYDEVQSTQSVLQELKDNGNSDTVIATQEEAVKKAQKLYDEELNGQSALNPQDVHEEIKEIESMERTVMLLEEKIVEINALLAA